MVREGLGETTLGVALGHIPGTAFPGEPGNVGVAGHRDTLFRSLQDIDREDLIVFHTLTGRYHYRVVSTAVVPPSTVSVLRNGAGADLTLVTCFPFGYVGSAPKRFVVKAKLVGGRDVATNASALTAGAARPRSPAGSDPYTAASTRQPAHARATSR